jgi:hypothetical protein
MANHMRVTCACTSASSFAATVIANNYLAANAGPSWAVANGVPATKTTTELYFPFVVEGPQGAASWRSIVGLTNLSTTTSNNVTLSFTSQTGVQGLTRNMPLPPNGGLHFSARDLFALTNGFQTGSVRVTSTNGVPLTGYVAYTELTAAGVAVVPPQENAQSKLIFEHIADLAPLATGMALLNAGPNPANIDVLAYTPAGILIGTANFSLPAGNSTSKLLRELIPQTQTRTSDGGFVFVQSSVPIMGIELFFSRDARYFGNVPAGPGNLFVPPPR